MAALFAIQIKEFPHDDKGLNFNGRWIGKYMGKTCVALLCPFTDLLAAGEFATLGVISVISLALWTTPSEFKAALWNLLKKKKPPGPPETPPESHNPSENPGTQIGGRNVQTSAETRGSQIRGLGAEGSTGNQEEQTGDRGLNVAQNTGSGRSGAGTKSNTLAGLQARANASASAEKARLSARRSGLQRRSSVATVARVRRNASEPRVVLDV
jgi:hypothetical protein